MNTLTSSFSAYEKQTESWVNTLTPSVSVCKKQTDLNEYSHIFLLCLWETNWIWVTTLTSSFYACEIQTESWVTTLTSSVSACEKQTDLSEYSHIFLLCLWETNWTWVNTLTSSFSACEKQTKSEWILSHLPSLLVRYKLNPRVTTLTPSVSACEIQTESKWLLSHLPSMLVRNKLNLSEYSHIFLLCLWETNWIWVNTLTSSFSACEKQTESWVNTLTSSVSACEKQTDLSEYSHIFLLCLWETNWTWVNTLTSSVSACEKQTESEWILSHLPSMLVRNKLNRSEYSHIFLLCLWDTNWVQVTTLTSSFYACEKQTEPEWIFSHLPSLPVRNKLNLTEYSHIFLLCLWETNWVQVTTLTSSVSACEKQTDPEWILSHLPSMLVRNKLNLSEYSHIFLLCLWETNWVQVTTLTSSFYACEIQTESKWLLSHLPSLFVRNKLNLSEYSHIFLLCLWETNWIWVNTLTSSFYACEIQTESKWLLSHLPSMLVRNKLSPEWIFSHLPSLPVRNKLNLTEYSHIFLLLLVRNKLSPSDYSHIFLLCLWDTNWVLSDYSHIFLLCLWETNWVWVNTLTSSFYACEKQTEPEWILSHLPSLPVRNKLNLSEYSHIFLLCLWDTNWVLSDYSHIFRLCL